MNSATYRHLLLAVDFAPATDPVVEQAEKMRRQIAARLSLVHVVEFLPTTYMGDLVLPDDFDLERQLLDVAQKQMRVLGERLEVPPEDRHIETGTTGRAILRVAAEVKADLIVVGSHGRHGWAALLGSTARTVLNGAHCDVLAVRIKEH